MREFTLRFWEPDGYLHSYAAEFASHPDIEPKYTHRMKVLEGGTATKLIECTGPPETVREVVGSADRTIDLIVSDEQPVFYYVHFEPDPVERRMMEARRETSLALKMPIELRSDGSVVATYVGAEEDVDEAVDLLPDGIEAEVLSIRDEAVGDGAFAGLTDRQREVLATAVELGYYGTPRTATQADVAAEIGVSAATVGEHLRKIEARVFEQFVR